MLRCGTAFRDITPAGPVYLMGYAARRGKATDGAVHDPLFVKALYLENSGIKALVLSLDLCELSLPDARSLSDRIKKATGAANVLVSVTHTHSAPITIEGRGEETGFDPIWFETVCEKAVEAAVEAAGNLFPARAGAGAVSAPEVGKNRRPDSDVTDPALSVLKVEDESGAVRAILLNYACHCTILDGNSYTVSADYPGYLYTKLAERYPGALTLFTNGAAGDINIGYSSDASALGEPMAFRSFETAERMAGILFEKACAALQGISTRADAPLACRRVTVAYPLRRGAPSDAELAETVEAYERFLSGDAPEEEKRKARIKQIYAQSLRVNLHAVGRRAAQEADSYLLRVDGALLVTFPVELFCEVGLALKERLPKNLTVFPVGYAGGYIGYLPTERAMRAGGYEAETSPFAPDADQALLNALSEGARGMG